MKSKITFALFGCGFTCLLISLVFMSIKGCLYKIIEMGEHNEIEASFFSFLFYGYNILPFITAIFAVLWVIFYIIYLSKTIIFTHKEELLKTLNVGFSWILSICAAITASFSISVLKMVTITFLGIVACVLIFIAAIAQSSAFLISAERAIIDKNDKSYRKNVFLNLVSVFCVVIALVLMAIPGSAYRYFLNNDSTIILKPITYYYSFPIGYIGFDLINLTLILCIGLFVSLALPLYLRHEIKIIALILSVLASLSGIIALIFMPAFSWLGLIITLLIIACMGILIYKTFFIERVKKGADDDANSRKRGFFIT